MAQPKLIAALRQATSPPSLTTSSKWPVRSLDALSQTYRVTYSVFCTSLPILSRSRPPTVQQFSFSQLPFLAQASYQLSFNSVALFLALSSTAQGSQRRSPNSLATLPGDELFHESRSRSHNLKPPPIAFFRSTSILGTLFLSVVCADDGAGASLLKTTFPAHLAHPFRPTLHR